MLFARARQDPHAAIHQILGGRVTSYTVRFEGVWLRHYRNSEMAGASPRGLAPPDCVRGPKLSPNGRPFSPQIHSPTVTKSHSCPIDPMFMMHHAVR